MEQPIERKPSSVGFELLAWLRRAAGKPMDTTAGTFKVSGGRVEVLLDDLHANPSAAVDHMQGGRHLVVRHKDGRRLFTIGSSTPDPFPVQDEPDDESDVASAVAPASGWLG